MKTYLIEFGDDTFSTTAKSYEEAFMALWDEREIKSKLSRETLVKIGECCGIDTLVWVWNHNSPETITNPIARISVFEESKTF